MARSRNIKPSFFTNDVLADCCPLARLLFAGLWTIADRDGRLEDRPKKIKIEILPYDECNIDDLLDALDVAGFIMRYTVNKNDYIQIVSFKKHQNPHQKELPSLIPEPDKSETSTRLAPDKNSSSPALTLNPHPLTLNPHPSSLSPIAPKGAFAEWYAIYPHKVGKAAAEKKFSKAIKTTSLEILKQGVERYIRDKPPDRNWCNPATWLHQERWTDQPQEIQNANQPSRNSHQNQKRSNLDKTLDAVKIANSFDTAQDLLDAINSGASSGWAGSNLGREFSGEPQIMDRTQQALPARISNLEEEGSYRNLDDDSA